MANVVLAVLTGVLVVVVGYYAFQTHLTVRELKAARAAQVLPRLIPALGLLGAGNTLLRVVNVGSGPALGIDLYFSLEPGGEERHWTTAVVAMGEHHDFVPAPNEPNGLVGLDALTSKYELFRLRATFKDALGVTHSADESLDVRQEWESLKAVKRVLPPDHLEEISKSLKKIADELNR